MQSRVDVKIYLGQLSDTIVEMKVGQMVHREGFTLIEAMSALEVSVN
jgi:hypothetical protein